MTIPSAILSLLLTLLLSASGSVQLKAWNASNTTRLMYEQDKQTIDVAKGKALTVIDIYDNMICLMNIHVRSIITHQGPLQNIFHIGNNKKDQNYPSIFIDKNPNNGFKIRLTNSHMSRNTFSTHINMQVNTTYRIKIQCTQTSFVVELNGMPLFFDPTFSSHVLHIYGWNNPAPQAIYHVHISHNLQSTQSDLEFTSLNQILGPFLATWIVVSVYGVIGVILFVTVVCLGYLNYQKLTQEDKSINHTKYCIDDRLTTMPIDSLLCHSTYLSLFIPYLSIKHIFSNLVVVSKYQLSFMNHNDNKAIIRRLITSQIGSIFTISQSFTRYYFNQSTNPYKLIPMFYTNFGFIQQIAFPKHHQKITTHCNAWQQTNNGIDWDTVEVNEGNDGEEYYNPFDWQYNAIKYDRIPFDFVVLLRLKNAQLVINWLTYVLNQEHINSDSDLTRMCLNIPKEDDPVLNGKYEDVVMITAINNYDRAGGGYPLFDIIIEFICDWPCIEFAKLIRFMLHNTGDRGIHAGFVLCKSLMWFCSVDDLASSSANYCNLLKQYIKMKQNAVCSELLSVEILVGITRDMQEYNLLQTMFHIIYRQYNGERDHVQSANHARLRMFETVGAVLWENMEKKQLETYFTFLDENAHEWTEFGGVEYRELFLNLLGLRDVWELSVTFLNI
eukprot:770383_1